MPWDFGTAAVNIPKTPDEVIYEKSADGHGHFSSENAALAATAEQAAFDQALTIFHKDVRDANGVVEPFSIHFRVGDGKMSGISWSGSSHPKTPTADNRPPELENANTANATLSGLTQGGVYRYNLDAFGELTGAQIWLPTAGPDIREFMEKEIAYFRNTWSPKYRAKLSRLAEERGVPEGRQLEQATKGYANAEMLVLGPLLDWANDNDIRGDKTPCGLADVAGGAAAGDQDRFTLYGVVIDFAKRNNMFYGFIRREMGLGEEWLLRAPDEKDTINKAFKFLNFKNDIGTRDSPAAKEAYRAGFDVSKGVSLQQVMKARGLKMQEPNMRAAKEWPSNELSDGSLVRVAGDMLNKMIE